MNRKRSQLQAYFAGIFDGEGHVGIRHNQNTYVLQVIIQMNDPQAILLMDKEYPGAHLRVVRNVSGTDGYYLQWSQHKAYEFLNEILPFLIVKHEQAKVALAFINHRRRDHSDQTGWRKGKPRDQKRPDCLRCAKSFADLLRIRAEIKQVNSVNALLEHEMREYRAKPEDVEQDVAAMTVTLVRILEGLETRLSQSSGNKTVSACEQDIVQEAA